MQSTWIGAWLHAGVKMREGAELSLYTNGDGMG